MVFINFESRNSAETAISQMNNAFVFGRRIRVEGSSKGNGGGGGGSSDFSIRRDDNRSSSKAPSIHPFPNPSSRRSHTHFDDDSSQQRRHPGPAARTNAIPSAGPPSASRSPQTTSVFVEKIIRPTKLSSNSNANLVARSDCPSSPSVIDIEQNVPSPDISIIEVPFIQRLPSIEPLPLQKSDSLASIEPDSYTHWTDDQIRKLIEIENNRLKLVSDEMFVLMERQNSSISKLAKLNDTLRLKSTGAVFAATISPAPTSVPTTAPTAAPTTAPTPVSLSGQSSSEVRDVRQSDMYSGSVPFQSVFERNWILASRNSRQVLTSIKPIKVGRLDRKIRSLVLNSFSKKLSEIVVTTHVSGGLQVWDMSTQTVVETVTQSHLSNGWCEDSAWVSSDCLAMAAQKTDQTQLSFLKRCEFDPTSNKFRYDLVNLKQKPHASHISVIEPLDFNYRGGAEQISFFTGGKDHQVYLWETADLNDKDHSFAINPIFNLHSSCINALSYNRRSKLLMSGGEDRKMIVYNVETKQIIFGNDKSRHEFAIREILPIYAHDRLSVIG